MQSSALNQRLEAASEIVAEAATLAMRMRPAAGSFTGNLKGAQDWVTEADGAVEALIAGRLRTLFPDDGFKGEETGESAEGAGAALRWVVDPIDGTSNYARGRDRWAVSLGLMDGDRPVLGLVAAPVLRETFMAREGGGATLNGAPIRPADTADMRRAMVEVGWSPKVTAEAHAALTGRIVALGAAPRTGGCGAIALVEIACGRLDAYIEPFINVWDVAGALPVLAEARVRVSPFLRDGGMTGAWPILAATPGIAAAVSAASGIGFD
ncbi:inositol monophosphatase [Lichenicoccus roseus]|uniref:Inositol monophosphatase n=2 Tax=Lichenicoccus roseus TaxID=2683649 RepID=A0A5R9JA04_9PROT|nr:inositol monophosphatase [Lichenicoccus roseus]TLU73633.1 inositol monophosphatase [Lichenicoccus roseus]